MNDRRGMKSSDDVRMRKMYGDMYEAPSKRVSPVRRAPLSGMSREQFNRTVESLRPMYVRRNPMMMDMGKMRNPGGGRMQVLGAMGKTIGAMLRSKMMKQQPK